MSIIGITARQIFDSRGTPTVEVDVTTKLGVFRASVPSGISTGIYEAHELRDGEEAYLGKGVQKAVRNVNHVLGLKLMGMQPVRQHDIDETMIKLDGTENKKKYGANAILGISLALSKAGARELNLPLYTYYAELAGNMNTQTFELPVPAFNVINGGAHADNSLAFQEFMIMPIGASSFSEAMRMGTETYQHLKVIIKKKYGGGATNVGDEGGFAPNLKSAEEGLDLLVSAIEKAGYTGKVKIAIDAAASEFYENGKYNLDWKIPGSSGKLLSSSELASVYEEYVNKYPIVSIEDPFSQDDWEAYEGFCSKLGKKIQIVGDDLLVTNTNRISEAVRRKACNALLLKVNQIGTISEAIAAAKMAAENHWTVMMSHRSGETEDTTIADLAVGIGTNQIKAGSLARSERLAKYNQLLRIEEELGQNAKYAGPSFPYQ
ncbi:uncharacterized protein LOC126326075 [Schistocerca gregaria]|uniref:uncharacterized protein LOC126326075 n=1 Tax=Schistocerca gregaria TaxID=7010 RepID=UPI00211DC6A9|nr:uncharacterized protein LOC126326075 [Schistocerca gregaria]